MKNAFNSFVNKNMHRQIEREKITRAEKTPNKYNVPTHPKTLFISKYLAVNSFVYIILKGLLLFRPGSSKSTYQMKFGMKNSCFFSGKNWQ